MTVTTIQSNPIKTLYSRLNGAGIDTTFLRNVVFPSWWDDSIAETPSGYHEALGILAKGLGLSVNSLLDDGCIAPSATAPLRYKRKHNVDECELRGATCVALRAASLACSAAKVEATNLLSSAADIRTRILNEFPGGINLNTLLEYCWSSGVPALHLSRLPRGKKMDGLAVVLHSRPSIIICKNIHSPAWMVFYVAHELGHIVLNHLGNDGVLVDEQLRTEDTDSEEQAANQFAIELLTGNPQTHPQESILHTASSLAKRASLVGEQRHVDPGVLALNYAWAKNDWKTGNAALKILEDGTDAISLMKRYAEPQLNWDCLAEEEQELLRRLLVLMRARRCLSLKRCGSHTQ